MRPLLITAAFATLAGCMEPATPVSAPASAAITEEAAFRSAIVGKTLDFNGSTFTVNANGTISGPWDGSGISGTWTWEDGAFCREGQVGARVLELDCQTWAVNGNVATVTRDRGAGQSFDYTIS
ncbi:MAG: dihydrodipicolinate reductase [Pseudomonadota bacterium]